MQVAQLQYMHRSCAAVHGEVWFPSMETKRPLCTSIQALLHSMCIILPHKQWSMLEIVLHLICKNLTDKTSICLHMKSEAYGSPIDSSCTSMADLLWLQYGYRWIIWLCAWDFRLIPDIWGLY